METVYASLKMHTCRIASQYPLPDFYRHFVQENRYSIEFLRSNHLLSTIKKEVSERLTENLGHGLEHAFKVTVDAGTLVIIEGRLAGYSKLFIDRLLLLVQTAALLHDVCRTEENHARKGAETARSYLSGHPFSEPELEDICRAIHNHEAFKKTSDSPTQAGGLLSDCLYDADKFRWGKDNFSQTLWDMLLFSKVPVSQFVSHYPAAMDTLLRIRKTFRTRTGKKYGPAVIDIGLSIGKALYRVMDTEFHLL